MPNKPRDLILSSTVWRLALTLFIGAQLSACASDERRAADRGGDTSDTREESSSASADEDDDDPSAEDDAPADDKRGVDASTSAKPDARASSSVGAVRDAKAEGASMTMEGGSSAKTDGSSLHQDAGALLSDASASGGTREDLGKGDGHDVIAIGDSWMSMITTGIQQSLVKISKQKYRTYGVPGTRLLNEQIPNQYKNAKKENPDIKTVIMTGGGNDILQTGLTDDCAELNDACKETQRKIADRTLELTKEMATDGVKDVISIGYSRGDGQYKASIEYGIATFSGPEWCPQGVRCWRIDSDEIIHGMLADGIHPTAQGCDDIATYVLKLMEDNGLRR